MTLRPTQRASRQQQSSNRQAKARESVTYSRSLATICSAQRPRVSAWCSTPSHTTPITTCVTAATTPQRAIFTLRPISTLGTQLIFSTTHSKRRHKGMITIFTPCADFVFSQQAHCCFFRKMHPSQHNDYAERVRFLCVKIWVTKPTWLQARMSIRKQQRKKKNG